MWTPSSSSSALDVVGEVGSDEDSKAFSIATASTSIASSSAATTDPSPMSSTGDHGATSVEARIPAVETTGDRGTTIFGARLPAVETSGVAGSTLGVCGT
jgi:hypothetical protein